jgi:3-oxoacyl-[acyl-carrier protein] reductase
MNAPSLADSGLAGGVAIVTGGSRGIGRAIVETLVAAGMEVIFTYLGNAAAAQEGIAAITAALPNAKISAKAVDVRDSAACQAFTEEVADRTERIDVLVNNAGVIRDGLLGMLSDDDIRTVLATNVEGAFNMCRSVVPFMMSKRRGRIINISSVSGEKGGRGQTNYAASKGAINGMTRSLACEVASRNIRVNAVAPGVIDTEMSKTVRELAGDQITSRILLKRIGKPDDIAHAVWFLASRYSDYITGQVLSVDGGFKMD